MFPAQSCGSSPRMRGKQKQKGITMYTARFIPAHAGKTTMNFCAARGSTVHPRACGENCDSKDYFRRGDGSSPRMRGKRKRRYSDLGLLRFIPAHAGKTRRTHSRTLPSQVHPRACGENLEKMFDKIMSDGSSPRMRGKRTHKKHTRRRHGFIPAHAGKTRTRHSDNCPGGVHPRACGENLNGKATGRFSIGSSPRMRGKPGQVSRLKRARRFIPAHAGKTPECYARAQGVGVHPRACGENLHAVQGVGPGGGSSPRMRGKQAGGDHRDDAHGFIPAHAGKTSKAAWHCPGMKVHPRACGENSSEGVACQDEGGSSPRMRGKQYF